MEFGIDRISDQQRLLLAEAKTTSSAQKIAVNLRMVATDDDNHKLSQ
jgi:hypothetical protein